MTESIKQPEAKRLADELERPVGTQSTYSAMQQAAAELRRLHAEVERLRAQLPAGMQHCTIVFEQCAKGHGNLTATNWVRHPCLVCALDELRAEVERLRADAERYRWLRDMNHWPACFGSHSAPEPVRGSDLDAAIDAALKETK